jgi:hypothetical protein
MRHSILALVLLLAGLGRAQTIDSINFKAKLAGTWTQNYCDSLWAIEDWICVDTLTIAPDGFINSVRTCEKPIDFPEDEVYEPFLLGKEEWTRFDQINMKLYRKYYLEWDNSWSEEQERYRVISISKNEIRVECDAYVGLDFGDEILRIIYKRVK